MGLFRVEMAPAAKTGIAAGRNAGHITTKRTVRAKPSRKAGSLGKRVKFVREIVREVAGFAPYERRCLELLKVGRDKRARKFCKSRLGTMRRAKRKVEEMNAVI